MACASFIVMQMLSAVDIFTFQYGSAALLFTGTGRQAVVCGTVVFCMLHMQSCPTGQSLKCEILQDYWLS